MTESRNRLNKNFYSFFLIFRLFYHPLSLKSKKQIIAETTFVASTNHSTIDLWKLHSIIPDGTPLITKTDADLVGPNFPGFMSFEAHQARCQKIFLKKNISFELLILGHLKSGCGYRCLASTWRNGHVLCFKWWARQILGHLRISRGQTGWRNENFTRVVPPW